jgi:uncharacterized protein (UPF0335 family)
MTGNRISTYIARIERLLAERAEINGFIRQVYAEAKADGHPTAILRKLIARRQMTVQQRFETDETLAAYEAAIEMAPAEAEASVEKARPDAAAVALNMLTAEIVALEDAEQAAALVEHMLFLLDLRAEIAVLRSQESARRKLAKDEGFEAKQLALAVRWFEKVAKHGLEAMKAGEATFNLYRSTFDAREAERAEISERDRALMEKFAGRDPAKERRTARAKRLSGTLAMLNAMDQATKGGAGNG